MVRIVVVVMFCIIATQLRNITGFTLAGKSVVNGGANSTESGDEKSWSAWL